MNITFAHQADALPNPHPRPYPAANEHHSQVLDPSTVIVTAAPNTAPLVPMLAQNYSQSPYPSPTLDPQLALILTLQRQLQDRQQQLTQQQQQLTQQQQQIQLVLLHQQQQQNTAVLTTPVSSHLQTFSEQRGLSNGEKQWPYWHVQVMFPGAIEVPPH